MQEPTSNGPSRREFLKTTSKIAATTALAGAVIPRVHAAGDETVRLVLVGCGGRGTGAVSNALSVTRGPVKLVAMADVLESRLGTSFQALQQNHAAQVEVPADQRFVGMDAYQKAMDCLQPGDIAICATPPAFRWVHFTYAISKGLHVFMEKPVTVDGPTSRRMLQLGEEATKKNLKVGVGLMSRHSRPMQELAKRVHDGEIGEIILQRGYRMHGPLASFASTPKPPEMNELMYQIQRFHSFLWASGGCFSDFYIHIIDHLCWMKNAWPVRAQALGGRHYRLGPEGVPFVDQNFDVYGVEYTYADGSTFMFDGRCMNGCDNIYASYLHGTNGMAIASKSGDCGQPSSIYRGQTPNRGDRIWQSEAVPGETDPYQNEWNDLIDAIRDDKPYNEVQRGVETSLVTSMGRMAAHTGRVITYDEILNGDHEFAPGLDQLTLDSPAPLQAGPDGKYPVPQPGLLGKREY